MRFNALHFISSVDSMEVVRVISMLHIMISKIVCTGFETKCYRRNEVTEAVIRYWLGGQETICTTARHFRPNSSTVPEIFETNSEKSPSFQGVLCLVEPLMRGTE